MEHPLIVLADDDKPIIDMLSDLLEDEGYDTICCYSGEAAYLLITQRLPAFVILDLQMEQLDSGLDVLQMMRFNPATSTIPVLICSADGVFLRSKQEQLKVHRCEVLEKPFDIVTVLAIIERALAP